MERKDFSSLFLIFTLVGIFFIPSFSSAQQKIHIATAVQGGGYYATGAAIAQALNKWGGLNATAQATGGGAENCRLIESGKVDMATIAGQQIIQAYRIVKTTFEHIDFLVSVYKAARQFDLNRACAIDFGIPYHSGAVRYFKERGVWKR